MERIDYSTDVETLVGEPTDLNSYKGKVLLIVNTASKCGFTPQYEGLQELYDEYANQGFEILGFPCNQFANQEPEDASTIADFCRINYGVSFPMFAKIDVNGANTHPLFQQLKGAAPGVLGSKSIKWNFTKFLVSRDGTILKRYSSNTTPSSLKGDIATALAGEAWNP